VDQLYNNLLKLVSENEAFYYVDYGPYRVFNYRLASYTDFLAPDALEARGIMFYIGDGDDKVKLVCRPFKKFFNLGENPFTMDLDMTQENIHKVAIKEDGSIISSYIDVPTGELRLKSKQSLVSEQTRMANDFLSQPENWYLKQDTTNLTKEGFTVIFELVSPTNRIVLEYPRTQLRVLGVRSNEYGGLLDREDIVDHPALFDLWCAEYDYIPHVSVPGLEGIEGYVYTLKDQTMVKVKTNWYKTLHNLKDSISAVRHLYEAIIDERIDDVKSMFATDEYTIRRIEDMEQAVVPKYNHMVNTVEDFYQTNKNQSRKDYAIKGQQELKGFFSLAMEKYIGREPDYKHFAKKYREEHFGIKASEEFVANE
jgi:T4 RnlA family RNA ligase